MRAITNPLLVFMTSFVGLTVESLFKATSTRIFAFDVTRVNSEVVLKLPVMSPLVDTKVPLSADKDYPG